MADKMKTANLSASSQTKSGATVVVSSTTTPFWSAAQTLESDPYFARPMIEATAPGHADVGGAIHIISTL